MVALASDNFISINYNRSLYDWNLYTGGFGKTLGK